MKFARGMVVLVLFSFALVASPMIAETTQQENVSSESNKEIVKQEASNQEESKDEFKPVDNMHHFMEYISTPSYMELRKILANEKVSRGEWRKVKQHALILAETSKLVAERGPDNAEQNADWKKISLTTHQQGAALYRAASKRDREIAIKHYGAMMDACNLCHKKYDPKNHQLAK